MIQTFFATVLACAGLVALDFGQQTEPSISNDVISVHEVRHGTMPLREIATGTITSLNPSAAAITTLKPVPPDALKPGQAFSVQVVIGSARMIAGTIAHVISNDSGLLTADIAFSQPLPDGASVGTRVGALVDVGEARDIVFFDRPGDAKPDTTSTIFLIEPNGAFAKRVTVKYGRQAGSMLEILSGLSPGDRVIVTDMSKFAGTDRVRLQSPK